MKRANRSPKPPRPGAASGPARPERGAPRRPPRALLIALLAVAIPAAALLAWRRSVRPPAGAAGMEPVQAAVVGARLVGEQRWSEALPYLRRAAEGPGAQDWVAHLELARTLGRVSLLTERKAGLPLPLARTSLDRVAAAREAGHHFASAIALAPGPAARATAEAAQAEVEFAWGRAWEAFILLRRAQADAPGDQSLARRADDFQLLLEHPERFRPSIDVFRTQEAAGGR